MSLDAEASQLQATRWLEDNGPKELELLFRAIVYHPAVPILIADNDRNYRDASAGAGKLLGLPRDKIIGCRLDDFAAPASKPKISQLAHLLGTG
jgi:formate hydrogenlyase transcriptional activator